MIQLPRLLDSSMKEIARLSPSSLALDLYMVPLSTATMVLDESQPTVNAGAFVEIFTASGSAGIFRVQQTAQEVGGARTISLEHGIVTLSDNIIPGKLEKPETTTVRAAMAKLLENQTLWALGTVEIPDAKTISWEYDYSALLDSVLSIMDRFPDYRLTFDQSTTPWKVNIVSVPTETASECRLTRNIVSLSVEEDFSEVCTRLYIPNRAEPLEADTIGAWGAITRSLIGDEWLTEDELLAYGQRFLDEHKNPALTVTIDALDLSAATGESMDALHLGYLCRVCLPDYGQTINRRITVLSYPDLLSNPESVTATLASPAENTATALSSLLVDTTVQRRLIYKNGQELNRLIVRVIANEEAIDIITPQLGILTNKTTIHANEILTLSAGLENNTSRITMTEDRIDQQANEITLQGKKLVSLQSGVDDNAASITLANGRIDQQANEITLHGNKLVSLQSGVDDNAASITLANGRIDQQANEIALKASQASLELANGRIDAQAEEIDLKADKITLNGYVKMTSFEAEISDIKDGYSEHFTTDLIDAGNIMVEGTLNGGYVTAENLNVSSDADVNALRCTSLAVDSKPMTLKTQNVAIGMSGLTQNKRYLNVMLADGGTAQLDIVTDVSFKLNYTTIQYLGYDN